MPRRLSTRRGSVSASDPWGVHSEINLNPNRASSSTLTILRVSNTNNTSQHEPIRRYHPSHRRRQSAPDHPRLSFAFSTGPASTSSARPSSPTSFSSATNRNSFIKPRLPPDQVVDLARQSAIPRFLAPNDDTESPVTFTPLPPSVYLPFVNRPAEVAALLSTPPSSKLFALLAQTFPRDSGTNSEIPTDPTTWSYSHLSTWLTEIDREIAPDPQWALQARKCILARSELIWERVKGALGIPPDLDVDVLPADDDYDNDVFESESDCSGIGPSERRNSAASWLGNDEFQHSPVNDRPVMGAPLLDDFDSAHLAQFAALTISPLLATPTPGGNANQQTPSSPPPHSQDSGLQGISEAAEDDEADPDVNPISNPTTTPEVDAAATEAQIHGLRISTRPLSFAAISSTAASPSSPPPSFPVLGSAVSSRSGSFSSLGGPAAAARHISFSSTPFRRSASFGSFMTSALSSNARSRTGYDVSRADGRPLFPSTFARMARGGSTSATHEIVSDIGIQGNTNSNGKQSGD